MAEMDYGDVVLTTHYAKDGSRTTTVVRADRRIGVSVAVLEDAPPGAFGDDPDGFLVLPDGSRYRPVAVHDPGFAGGRVLVCERVEPLA